MTKMVVLVYNGEQELEIARESISESCFFLSCLLNGPFMESRQSRVHIKLEDFSFEVFKGVVLFAKDKSFDRTQTKMGYYMDMLQLAALWTFQELVNLLELFLIDNISLDTVMDFHMLANMLGLAKLKEACFKFEQVLDRGNTVPRNWGRCPRDGHQNHSYTTCITKRHARGHGLESWDEEDDELVPLTEDEKETLAELRELRKWCS